MIPYYEDGSVTIYHGDCRKILPTLDLSPAMVLTDPPYGIDYQPVKASWPKVHGDDEPFDPEFLLGRAPAVVLFGANYYADRLPLGGWIVWSKAQDNRWLLADANHRSTGEMAWTSTTDKVLVYNCFWAGSPLYRNSERGSSLHPTQKPVELMAWIIEKWTAPGDLILDPYMGSGPVARAAKDLGRKAIGVEIEERYCEIAAQRCAQEVLDFGGAA